MSFSSSKRLLKHGVGGRVVCSSISELVISHFATIESIFLLYTNLSDLYASSFELETFLAISFARICHPCNLFSHIGIAIGNHITFENVLHTFT
jgi:hypothetical protein